MSHRQCSLSFRLWRQSTNFTTETSSIELCVTRMLEHLSVAEGIQIEDNICLECWFLTNLEGSCFFFHSDPTVVSRWRNTRNSSWRLSRESTLEAKKKKQKQKRSRNGVSDARDQSSRDSSIRCSISSGIPEEIQEKSEVEREDRERRTQTTQERGKRGKAIFSECLHREEGT